MKFDRPPFTNKPQTLCAHKATTAIAIWRATAYPIKKAQNTIGIEIGIAICMSDMESDRLPYTNKAQNRFERIDAGIAIAIWRATAYPSSTNRKTLWTH